MAGIGGRLGRWLPAAPVALLLAGCGAQPQGAVIGVRGAVATAPGYQVIDAAAINQRISADLSQIGGVGAIGEQRLAGELPLTSTLSVNQSERLIALKKLGDSEIASRLNDIGALESVMSGMTRISGYERGLLLGRLAAAYGGLNALRAKIDADTLVDVARGDVRSIATGFRVAGLLDPQVRLMAAAAAMLQLAALYNTELSQLQGRMNANLAIGQPVGNAPQLLADLQRQITTMTSAANQAAATLPGLAPAGYPGVKPVLAQMRSLLGAARTAEGRAGNDALGARAIFP